LDPLRLAMVFSLAFHKRDIRLPAEYWEAVTDPSSSLE
jgi:hypothetical protein